MTLPRRSLLAATAAAGMAVLPNRGRAQTGTGTPYKLGVLTDMGGINMASGGPGALLAATMAVEDHGGRVLDRPIVVISGDHQNKPDIGATLARRWYDEDAVQLILDVPTSPVALAVQQIARDKGKAVIFSSAATSVLTGTACSPTGAQWSMDTYAVAKIITRELVARGKKRWLFIGGDYAYGISLENDATTHLTALGASVVGTIRHPLGTNDFSSFLLQAQASPADVIAITAGGDDLSNLLKQANEFGLTRTKTFASFFLEPQSIQPIGLASVQGLFAATGWYWDLNADTRAFSARFEARHHAVPSMAQAGVYSATMQYLRAVQAAGTGDAAAVMHQLQQMKVSDMFTRDGTLRLDGRMVHDMYLIRVKAPAESKGPWDLFSVESTVPGTDAFRPLAAGGCPLVKS